MFKLIDAWIEPSGGRTVFKFKLEMFQDLDQCITKKLVLEHSRFIPSPVKREVWKRDKGKCVMCGSTENLRFDHIMPYSKGGTSLSAKNIQILCLACNIKKGDKIE